MIFYRLVVSTYSKPQTVFDYQSPLDALTFIRQLLDSPYDVKDILIAVKRSDLNGKTESDTGNGN